MNTESRTRKSGDFEQLLSQANQSIDLPSDHHIGPALLPVIRFVNYCETHRLAALQRKGCEHLQTRLAKLREIEKENGELQNLAARLNAAIISEKEPDFLQQSPLDQVELFHNLPDVKDLFRWFALNRTTTLIAHNIGNWRKAKAWNHFLTSHQVRAHDFRQFLVLLQTAHQDPDHRAIAKDLARKFFEKASDNNLRLFLHALSDSDRQAFFELAGEKPFKRLSLSLSGCNWAFENDALKLLLQRLPKLQTLDLSHCFALKDEHLAVLSQCHNLRLLNLSNSPGLTGTGLQHLDPFKNMLQGIRLRKCANLNNHHLEHLKGFSQLQILDLAQAKLEDKDLAFVRTLPSLTEVNLSQNSALSDAVFNHFAHLGDSLETFILRDGNITGEGLVHFSPFKKLHALDFEDNRLFQDSSIAHLNGLTSLQVLNFNQCPALTGKALRHFAKSETLTALHCRGWHTFSDGDLSHLGQNLTYLDLSANPTLTRSIVAPLATLIKLQTLLLNDCSQLDDRALEILPALSECLRLNLSGCPKITDRSLKHIGQLSQLERLALSGTGVKGADLHPLRKLEQLQELDLSGCSEMKTTQLAALLLLQSLAELNLKDCTGLTEDCLELFRQMPSLLRVSMHGCEDQITPAQIEAKDLTHIVQIVRSL